MKHTILKLLFFGLATATFLAGTVLMVVLLTDRPSAIQFDRPVAWFRLVGGFGPGEVEEERLIPLIRKACASPAVTTLVFRVNSEGGGSLTGERIGVALETFCSDKEIITLVEGYCLSACMSLATASDRIIANRYAFVGGIGTILVWTDYSGALAQDGAVERVIASGPAKVRFGEHLAMSPEHIADMTRAFTANGQSFVQVVRERRGERLRADAPIEAGGIFSASEALEIGLIDEIATIEQFVLSLEGEGITTVPSTHYTGDSPRVTRVERFLENTYKEEQPHDH